MKMKALKLHPEDNVAVALTELEPGGQVEVRGQAITVVDHIRFGHKIALCNIGAGKEVIKYGAPIGRATQDIKTGQHAHVHNLESRRARGDLGPKDKKQLVF
jgi:altronate dehydratase